MRAPPQPVKPPAGRADDIKRGRTKVGCLMCTKRRQTHCPPEWKDGELVDVRELAGLSSPWYFGAADDARAATRALSSWWSAPTL